MSEQVWSELAASAMQLEQRFKQNHYTGSKDGAALLAIAGTIPVLLSCPHAVKHPRWETLKAADSFTGTLGIQLAALSSAHALIYACTSSEDPNYDADGPYKQQVTRLIKEQQVRFVLDLHGISRAIPLDFALGTAYGAALAGRTDLLEAVQVALQQAGFQDVVIDEPRFSAAHPHNLASFLSRTLGIPALQLEIHKQYRDPEHAPASYARLLRALTEAISAIVRLL